MQGRLLILYYQGYFLQQYHKNLLSHQLYIFFNRVQPPPEELYRLQDSAKPLDEHTFESTHQKHILYRSMMLLHEQPSFLEKQDLFAMHSWRGCIFQLCLLLVLSDLHPG